VSLVRLEKKDVAAVAFYTSEHSITAYYSKNSIEEADIALAADLENLVRRAAKERATMKGDTFLLEYFEIVLRHAPEESSKHWARLGAVRMLGRKFYKTIAGEKYMFPAPESLGSIDE
jgi:hypothetical protein